MWVEVMGSHGRGFRKTWLTSLEGMSTIVPMQMPFKRKPIDDIRYKVDINPSYEWAPEAESLAVSHRELEVLALVVEGYKNREIGQILGIQHQSVKNHLQRVFKKLNVKNNTQAYIAATSLNMMRLREPAEAGLRQPVRDTSDGTV